jgi:hypothetical protein
MPHLRLALRTWHLVGKLELDSRRRKKTSMCTNRGDNLASIEDGRICMNNIMEMGQSWGRLVKARLLE